MQEESRPEVRELQEELSKLNSLEKHPGYIFLLELAKSQLEARKQGLFLNPLKKMDEVLEQEYKKGEIAGIFLFMEIVSSYKQTLEAEIQETLEEQENADKLKQDSNGAE